MVRHQDVAVDFKAVFLAGLFEDLLRVVAGGGSYEDVGVAVAADSDEVKVASSVSTFETFGHEGVYWKFSGMGLDLWPG